MPYIDEPDALKAMAPFIPKAQTAKMAIVRPTSHFAIVTEDNPDMMRTLKRQQAFVEEGLCLYRDTVDASFLAIKKEELVQQFQQNLANQALKEQLNLIEALKAHGIFTAQTIEDKGRLETARFEYYTDQVFATDTGQYFDKEGALIFIPAYFKNPQRKKEERLAIAQAENLNATVIPLRASTGKKLVFEGGDIRQMPGRSLFFIGQGHRSVAETAEAIAEISGYYVVPIKLMQAQFYHLDCCFLPLPNEAAMLYEGEYVYDATGEVLLDECGWPKLIPGTETLDEVSRARIRAIYSPEQLVLIDKLEALAFATNAAVLQNKAGRFKLFVNGDRTKVKSSVEQALREHLISLRPESIEAINAVTKDNLDIVEVPYRTLHGSGGSIRCSIQEVAVSDKALTPHKGRLHYFSERIEAMEAKKQSAYGRFFSPKPEKATEPSRLVRAMSLQDGANP